MRANRGGNGNLAIVEPIWVARPSGVMAERYWSIFSAFAMLSLSGGVGKGKLMTC